MELTKVQYVGNPADYQEYNTSDRALINISTVNAAFNPENNLDYIECHIYDLQNQLVYSAYSVDTYKIGTEIAGTSGVSSVELDPVLDLNNRFYDRGTYNLTYNFLRRQLNSNLGLFFWIKQISSTRTEIKVARQDLSNAGLSSIFDTFSAEIGAGGYYSDFYLNFGSNNLIIATNALYVEENGVGYILFKLYEPLPLEYSLKSTFWVVTKIAEPVQYEVEQQAEAEDIDTTIKLRGPNFNIDIKEKVGETTPYYNYTNLFTTSVSSSLQQLQSYFDEKGIRINVDYSNFTNFIHFSSATERLNNFVYKLSLIESYKASILQLSSLAPGANTNTLASSSKATLQSNIDAIITKFDPYEYYLYFTSASTAWPKSNDLSPYELYSATSSQALSWLGSTDTAPTPGTMSMLYSASLYDNTNSDGLRYTTPAYIRDDEDNEPYLVFLDMIGQHFDNIWLYYKDVTSRYDAQNNPNVGISLDLVGDALRAFGISLYTNTNVSDNIYYTLLGLNETGSVLPVTSSAYAQINLASSSLLPKAGDAWLSASIYLPPFENEKINKYVTPLRTLSSGATSSFQTISPNDLEAEVYKRLYHNLPYLLKTKGTERGVKALIACYGIPDSVLTIHEFGGYNMFTRPEILGIEDMKVYTGSAVNISGNVLSPFITTQEYFNDNERTSYDLEVGFSPADSINADITSSLQNLSIQQLIGDPTLQYSSSYTPLEVVKNSYFAANYTSRYDVWDFIRLIKYYNNSLFKMIKDFVPARASVSTGIIVKSHILERNKYARHEPTVTTSSYEPHIPMVTISGSDPDEIKYSTAYVSYTDTPSGSVPVYNIYSSEKYTGEFSGSQITVTDGQAFSQADFSISSTSGSIVGEINYGALFQNISGSVKSERFLDLDYSTDQVIPVNIGLITKSLDEGRLAIEDPYAPFAQLQDYNYALRRSTIPRYEGSKVSSLRYNTYTGPSGSYAGDQSYGLTAAIDRNSIKVAWVKNIPSQSLNFFEKTQIQLKYLVDINANTVDLNLRNANLFDVQNLFKSGDTVVVSLSDGMKPSFQKPLDGIKRIYRGGFSFDPILFRENNEKLTVRYLQEVTASGTTYPGYKAVNTDFLYYRSDWNGIIMSMYFPQSNALPTPTAQSVNIDTNFSSTINNNAFGYNWQLNGVTNGANQSPNPISDFGVTQAAFSSNLPTYAANSVKFDLAGAGSGFDQYSSTLNLTWTGNSALKSIGGTVNNRSAYSIQYNAFNNTGTNFGFVRGGETFNQLTDNENYILKAPRKGTYKINGEFSFLMSTMVQRFIYSQTSPGTNQHPFHVSGYSFKVVGVIEKSTNNGTTWTYAGSTKIKRIIPKGNVTYQSEHNIVKIQPGQGFDFKNNAPDRPGVDVAVHLEFLNDNPTNPDRSLTVDLDPNDLLRFRFFLYDMDAFLHFGQYLFFVIGRPNDLGGNPQTYPLSLNPWYKQFQKSDVDSLPYPYIQISEVSNPNIIYYNYETITDIDLLTNTSPQIITFSDKLSSVILSGSIFEPEGVTATYYSQVIDPLTVQPFDLVRIGSITNPNPDYYTVIETTTAPTLGGPALVDAVLESATVLTINGTTSQYSTISTFDANGSSFSLLNQIFNSTSRKFKILNISGINQTFEFEIKNRVVQQFVLDTGDIGYRYYYLLSNPNSIPPLPVPFNLNSFNPLVYGTTVRSTNGITVGKQILINPTSQTAAKFQIKLDRDLVNRGQLNQSFAILRPKPDETSVIINYRKQPGEVSQVMLIPQDVSTQLRDQIGNLYQQLNVNLSN